MELRMDGLTKRCESCMDWAVCDRSGVKWASLWWREVAFEVCARGAGDGRLRGTGAGRLRGRWWQVVLCRGGHRCGHTSALIAEMIV